MCASYRYRILQRDKTDETKQPSLETLEMGFAILGLGGRSADSGFTARYQLVRYISDERLVLGGPVV